MLIRSKAFAHSRYSSHFSRIFANYTYYSHMRYLYILIVSFIFTSAFSQTTDAKGRKQGYWKKKDEKTQRLLYEGEFRDDQPVGTFRYYYPNDSVRAIMKFSDGGKKAYALLYHMNGKRMAEGKYVNREIKDSIWTYYDELGAVISRESYRVGKKDGKFYVYLPDGKKSEEKEFKNDLQHGEFKEYFDGVNLKARGRYVDGQLEGRVAYFYPNGTEVAAGYYRNGKKNGPWIYKTESGKIREKELYRDGVLAGEKETREFFEKNKVSETTSTAPSTKKSSPESTKKKPETNHE